MGLRNLVGAKQQHLFFMCVSIIRIDLWQSTSNPQTRFRRFRSLFDLISSISEFIWMVLVLILLFWVLIWAVLGLMGLLF